MGTSNTFGSVLPLLKEEYAQPKFKKLKNLFRKKRSKLEISNPSKQTGK